MTEPEVVEAAIQYWLHGDTSVDYHNGLGDAVDALLRERAKAAPAMGDSFVLPGGESTSARLRQVQAALAASQADLTKALDDRDWWKQAAETAQLNAEQIARTADLARAELAAAIQRGDSEKVSRDQLVPDLMGALRASLDRAKRARDDRNAASDRPEVP